MQMKSGCDSPSIQSIRQGLEAKAASLEVADYIDETILPFACSHATDSSPQAIGTLLGRALQLAKASGTVADLLVLLASVASDEDIEAVDAIVHVYTANHSDEFIAAEALGALGVLADRSNTARAELPRIIQRLTLNSPRYLLVRAAKIVGRQTCLGHNLGLGLKLTEWKDADDLAVQSEARYQIARICLHKSLQQASRETFQLSLRECDIAFAQAEACEELRYDATVFRKLVELFDAYLQFDAPETLTDVEQAADNLISMVSSVRLRPWYGLDSAAEQVLSYRLTRIAIGFRDIGKHLSQSDQWIRLDEAVLELAAIFHIMWRGDTAQRHSHEAAELALPIAGPHIVAPPLGPFVRQAIGRTRLSRIVEGYECTHGQDDTVEFLQQVLLAVHTDEEAGPDAQVAQKLSQDQVSRLAQVAPDIAALLANEFPGVAQKLRKAGYELIKSGHGHPGFAVPTDAPGCLGNNPNIDEPARRIFAAARAKLGSDYPQVKWARFIDVVVSILVIFEELRQIPEPFTLCKEDGGKGNDASESDLQEFVFRHLRRRYGWAANWEHARVSGGRPDICVFFEDCSIPIELKAEHSDISPDHIREYFLGQPDDYATAMNRVACLLVLDLRETNAARHQKRRARAAKNGIARSAQSNVKLYTLGEGFWVDSLPVDPQLPGSKNNAVVVGLAPGNRTLPSSTSTYSRKSRSGDV